MALEKLFFMNIVKESIIYRDNHDYIIEIQEHIFVFNDVFHSSKQKC